jgi:hypothetical protein
MAPNLYKALRTIALRDVLTEPPEYHLRYIFRWYSEKFNVPLPDVPKLDLEHVLQTFYEVKYEEMDEENREKERLSLIETDEQRYRRLMAEEIEKATDVDFAATIEGDQALEAKYAPQGAVAPAAEAPKPIVPKLPEADLSMIAKLGNKVLPNVTMKFASDAEFKELLEGDTFSDPRGSNLPLKPERE